VKRRFGPSPESDDDEQETTRALRTLVTDRGGRDPDGPPDSYWTNMLVRSNQRIDEVSSGKGISISWAARVAIPGVVAIVSFMIALYYYVPERPASESSLTSVMMSLESELLDSMLVEEPAVGLPLSVAAVYGDPAGLPSEDILEYLIATGRLSALMQTLSEDQVHDLVARLSTHKNPSSVF
jgi:hypothetical protein